MFTDADTQVVFSFTNIVFCTGTLISREPVPFHNSKIVLCNRSYAGPQSIGSINKTADTPVFTR